MMARLSFALLLVVAALAQATILPALLPVGVVPNLVLVALLVWSALRGVAEGLGWVLVAGLLLDTMALDPLGTNGLALLPVALTAGLARRRFFRSGLVFPIVLAALATIGHGLILAVLRGMEGGLPALPSELPLAGVPQLLVLQALLNAVLVPPLYFVAGRLAGLAREKA
jgi:rod shape-determining protein MreD